MSKIFRIGDLVEKTIGDYRYRGYIVSIFEKRYGQVRFVVENDDGMLFIFNEGQLNLVK